MDVRWGEGAPAESLGASDRPSDMLGRQRGRSTGVGAGTYLGGPSGGGGTGGTEVTGSAGTERLRHGSKVKGRVRCQRAMGEAGD